MTNVRPTHKDADMSPAEIIRRYLTAYEAKDRDQLESVISANGFHFSSPQDDHIDREAYFARCWPMADKVESMEIEKIFAEEGEAFVQYVTTEVSGKRFRNVEFIRLSGPHIKQIDVYFGRPL